MPGADGGRVATAGYKDSSDIFIDANIQLAIRAAGRVRHADHDCPIPCTPPA